VENAEKITAQFTKVLEGDALSDDNVKEAAINKSISLIMGLNKGGLFINAAEIKDGANLDKEVESYIGAILNNLNQVLDLHDFVIKKRENGRINPALEKIARGELAKLRSAVGFYGRTFPILGLMEKSALAFTKAPEAKDCSKLLKEEDQVVCEQTNENMALLESFAGIVFDGNELEFNHKMVVDNLQKLNSYNLMLYPQLKQ